MDGGRGPFWAALSDVLGSFIGHKRQKLFHASEGCSSESAQVSVSERLKLDVVKVNESLHELYRPDGTPSMQVLFFHGLELADVADGHLCTWRSEDGSVIWPRDWLVEYFPHAHIYAVSYIECARHFDMYQVGENLMSDLMDGKIGQVPCCPVVLVAHCVGGLVIKEICLKARQKLYSSSTLDRQKEKLGRFLENLKGIFHYGTPHHGSSLIAAVQDAPLFNFFKVLNAEAARLNSSFADLLGSYRVQVHGLGEKLPTKSGLFQGVVVAAEASSREGEEFNMVVADHNSICKPKDRTDRRFYALKNLLIEVATKMEEEARVQEEKRLQDAFPQNFQHLPKEVIHMNAQMENVMGMLDNATTVGLTGMGGLGKTTLAMAIFNDLSSRFEYTCFVRDVKLIPGGAADVKAAVWDQLYCHGKNVEGRKNWSKLRGKTLFLVLDDISSSREEEVLLDLANYPSPESRFLLTSRDQGLLTNLGKVYVLPFWKDDHLDGAKVLFQKHAFPGQKVPPKELDSVMESIIKKCDGLPLTLEVVGKFLRRKQICEDWEQTLRALEAAEHVKDLDERLWAKLKVSYDDLGPKEQQIFLDATTFFGGEYDWTLGEALAAWSAAYETTSERLQWQTLVDMSLVYPVDKGEFIKVHEQLQSLGQRIALEASNNDKYRVWGGKVGLKMLQTNNEFDGKRIHAFRVGEEDKEEEEEEEDEQEGDGEEEGDVDGPECIHIPRAALPKLEKVQFLEVTGPIVIHGSPEGVFIPEEVVLLSCHGGDLFNPALQTRLAILKLFSLEDMPGSIGQLSCLKFMHLEDCNVQRLPNSFCRLKALQQLTLNGFAQLESLPESFGQLSSLNTLRLNSCKSLHTLPKSFGQLKSLHHLEFSYCDKLESLPESFGELNALSHLEFRDCNSLCHLPDSFGKLKSLHRLEFANCDLLESLPESFGELNALSHLEFQDCNSLCHLPDSFGKLKSLHHLNFNSCRLLKSLPESFGELNALNYLYFLAGNRLHHLPDSFGKLKSLHHLEFSFCSLLESLPESFGELNALDYLDFYECNRLHHLPDSFGKLKSLHHLEFLYCDTLESLPESFGELNALSHLEFQDCNSLCDLPDSFGKLKSLHRLEFIDCHELESLPESFVELTALSDLKFVNCSSLQHLPDSFGKLKSLRELRIDYYSATGIPDCIQELPLLHTLALYLKHDLVEPLPQWLVTPDVPSDIKNYSMVVFEVQEGYFSLKEISKRSR
ncbi:unnamed protein product [Calypogeia fissa]